MIDRLSVGATCGRPPNTYIKQAFSGDRRSPLRRRQDLRRDSMINVNTGEMTLCQSGFAICADLTQGQLESKIPDLILSHYETNGFGHYHVWCDVEQGEYVLAHLCFDKDTLQSVKLFPQHISRDAAQKEIPNMELEQARALMRAWCQRVFGQDQACFSQGIVRACVGADPIYSPPHIEVCYQS